MKAKKIIFTALAVLFQIALSSLAFAKPYGEKSRADSVGDIVFADGTATAPGGERNEKSNLYII